MLRPCRFPYAFPDTRVRLAEQAHSLARFSKRTTEHRLSTVPTVLSRAGRFSWSLSCPVALSPTDFRPYCTSRRGVLFSVRSRYLSAIGLESYLVLAVDAGQVREEYPIPATRELAHAVLAFVTGLSPCFALHSRRLHENDRTMGASPEHHIARRLRFGLCRFHSPLLTTSCESEIHEDTRISDSLNLV